MAVSATVNVLIGGYGCSAKGYEPLCAEMERVSGKPVVFIGSDRWHSIWIRGDRQYPRTMYRQAMHVVAELRRRNITRARLYGHSMGCIVALIVADAFPELVESVVLIAPAGVHVDGPVRLGLRFGRKVLGDFHNARHHPDEAVRMLVRTCVIDSRQYMFNVVRSMAEALALSRYRAFELLYPKLRERNIPVHVAYAADDTVFLRAQVLAAIAALQVNGYAFELKDVPHDVHYYPQLTAAGLQAAGLL